MIEFKELKTARADALGLCDHDCFSCDRRAVVSFWVHKDDRGSYQKFRCLKHTPKAIREAAALLLAVEVK